MISKTRLEAFSDGVLAVAITIMVLELKAPHGTELSVLIDLLPVFFSYVLSFLYIGIFWSNHHHLIHTMSHSNGRILLANLHLLFWISLVPFATSWMGENHFTAAPTALYGGVLLMSGFAYSVLQHMIIKSNKMLAIALGYNVKEKVSLFSYLISIPLAFYCESASQIIYSVIAVLWVIPDRRIERLLETSGD